MICEIYRVPVAKLFSFPVFYFTIFLQFIMIFQSFSHKRKNTFAKRTLHFPLNRFQQTDPTRHNLFESRDSQLGPSLSPYLSARSFFYSNEPRSGDDGGDGRPAKRSGGEHPRDRTHP